MLSWAANGIFYIISNLKSRTSVGFVVIFLSCVVWFLELVSFPAIVYVYVVMIKLRGSGIVHMSYCYLWSLTVVCCKIIYPLHVDFIKIHAIAHENLMSNIEEKIYNFLHDNNHHQHQQQTNTTKKQFWHFWFIIKKPTVMTTVLC